MCTFFFLYFTYYLLIFLSFFISASLAKVSSPSPRSVLVSHKVFRFLCLQFSPLPYHLISALRRLTSITYLYWLYLDLSLCHFFPLLNFASRLDIDFFFLHLFHLVFFFLILFTYFLLCSYYSFFRCLRMYISVTNRAMETRESFSYRCSSSFFL